MIAGPDALPRLTEQQRAALAASGVSVALGAGAGCGKTSVLTERFLGFLEGPPRTPLDRLVALTFTDRAARELRDRVRRACRAKLEGTPDLDDAGVAHWRDVLRGLEAAPIGTFHAFCTRILRRYAVGAGLDPGFHVLDEAIASTLRDEALAGCLRDWLAARDPDLAALAIEFGLRAVREAIGELMVHRDASELSDWADRDPDDLVSIWEDCWASRVRPLILGRVVDEARPCLGLLEAHTCTHPRMAERRAALMDLVPGLPDSADSSGVLGAIREAARVQGGGTKDHWPSEDVYHAVKKGFEALRKSVDRARERLDWDASATRGEAEHGLRFARLAGRAVDAYGLRKRSRGCLDFDDLLRQTLALLRGQAEAIRAEMAGTIDVILVDEFQDTDPIQGEILRLLAGTGPVLGAGRLFLVGDDKQSIYRFRGAQPGIFRAFREAFPVGGRLALTENFRSVPGILDFVNALFAEAFPGPDQSLRPGPRTPGRDDRPAVSFLWAVEPAADGPRPAADERRRVEARWIARHLAGRLADGWTVRDRATDATRPARPGDVALLFRSLNDAAAYEQALVAEGLDYYVVGGAAFYAQQEVHDLINLLSAIEDPLDAVALAGVLRSPVFAVSDEGLFRLSASAQPAADLVVGFGARGVAEGLSRPDRERVARARDLLARWRAAKDRLPIAGLIDRALDDSGYEASLVGEFLGPRKRANVRKLVRLARRFDSQGGFTLADFVARLRADLRRPPKEEQAATTDEEGDSIRLMTIHQAKGLEFPIVVLPDLDRGARGDTSQVAFHPELGPLVRPARDADPSDEADPQARPDDGPARCLGWSIHRRLEEREEDEEALRLFYVATTRARDHLILSASTSPGARPSSPALKLLDLRFDRSDGLFAGTLPEGWAVPAVRVIAEPPEPPPDRPGARARPRLARVSRLIRKAHRIGMRSPDESVIADPSVDSGTPSPPAFPGPLRVRRPRFVDLDPARRLGPIAARVDRLVRTILADPRGLDPEALPRVAERSARSLDPTPPPPIVAEALARLTPWLATPLARSLARAADRHRAVSWTIAWPPDDPEATVFRGAIDLLARDPRDGWVLVQVADAAAPEPLERLRLLLSARIAAGLGAGPIDRAWSLRFGTGGGLRGEHALDDAEMGRAVRDGLSRI